MSISPEITTIDGLFEWNKHLYEYLGWMCVAKLNNEDYKVSLYKQSINKLITVIINKMEKLSDEDKKSDLHSLLTHVADLDMIANIVLDIDFSSRSFRRNDVAVDDNDDDDPFNNFNQDILNKVDRTARLDRRP